MDISEAILSIEELPTAVDQVCAYAELIVYLRTLSVCSTEAPTGNVPWKNIVVKAALTEFYDSIDNEILHIKELMDITIRKGETGISL